MTPEFLIDSLKHEERQLLFLMQQNEAIPVLSGGDLVYGLGLAVKTLRDYRDGKIDLRVALIQYQEVSQITTECGSLLTLNLWEERRAEIERRKNDNHLRWQQLGWIEKIDGEWTITDAGRDHIQLNWINGQWSKRV